jgi:signal transduction histidine kinase
MAFRSIRSKLVSFAIIILCASIAGFCIVNGSMTVLITHQRYIEMKKKIEMALVDKGTTLIANNGIALRTLAGDNAFLAIREIVTSTVRLDPDLVYGIYMDKQRLPWVHALKNSEGADEEINPLSDSISMWAYNLKKPDYCQISASGDKLEIIEFAAPVVDESGTVFGTIRYGISTARMHENLDMLRKDIVANALFFTAGFFLIAGVVFFVGLVISRQQADAITKPLIDLSRSAAAITEGNYSLEVISVSHDETGILANHFEKMRKKVKEYTENLEKMVADRTEELEATQKELVEKAHLAGMADIASGTLHNVGNLLNSVKASMETIAGIIANSPSNDFEKANKILCEEMDGSPALMDQNTRLGKLLRYYLLLEGSFRESRNSIDENIKRLSEMVNAIGDVIAAQQNYAGAGGFSEKVTMSEIVEDALIMQSSSINRHDISIVRDYHDLPQVTVQKIKLMHVFINLIKNAKDAMLQNSHDNRILTISIQEDCNGIQVSFTDVGCGIEPQNLTRIFSPNFTTKKGGHGLGLHSSANFLNEMNGKIWAESNGIGTGAKFICWLAKDDAV